MMKSIELWHKRARPNPTDKDFSVQLGCHFEELAEMMDTLCVFGSFDGLPLTEAHAAVSKLAELLKGGTALASIDRRKELLDALADQIVTAVGVGHCARMDVPSALEEVNKSNWSKFDDAGEPIFNANGKIAKGPNYVAPLLEGMY